MFAVQAALRGLPAPVRAFARDECLFVRLGARDRAGAWTSRGGRVAHVIALRPGEQAAHTIRHELAHCWLRHAGESKADARIHEVQVKLELARWARGDYTARKASTPKPAPWNPSWPVGATDPGPTRPSAKPQALADDWRAGFTRPMLGALPSIMAEL